MRDAGSAARLSLVRSTALFTLLLAVTMAGIAWVATNAVSAAAWITGGFLALLATLMAVYVAQHLLDLRAAPVEGEGKIARAWARSDLIVAMQSYYIAVEGTVFRVPPQDYIHLREGMRVRIRHFPHTKHVISVERLPDGD